MNKNRDIFNQSNSNLIWKKKHILVFINWLSPYNPQNRLSPIILKINYYLIILKIDYHPIIQKMIIPSIIPKIDYHPIILRIDLPPIFLKID